MTNKSRVVYDDMVTPKEQNDVKLCAHIHVVNVLVKMMQEMKMAKLHKVTTLLHTSFDKWQNKDDRE